MQRGMMMQFDKLPLPVYVLRVEADASGLPQETALEGLTQNIEDYNENLKKYLSVDCYQPMYGYCGCFMRDVTQRRDMERQLYEEKERYRVAMESSIDLLFEYDIRLQVMHSWSNRTQRRSPGNQDAPLY